MENNLLTDQLPGYLSWKELTQYLTNEPLSRTAALQFTALQRANKLVKKIESLFVVDEQSLALADQVNYIIHNFLEDINPASPAYISKRYTTAPAYVVPEIITVVGNSGLGKSKSIARIFSQYPQIVNHKEFPHFQGEFKQVVYFSMLIRSKTRGGFLKEFAIAWNEVFLRDNPRAHPPIDMAAFNKLTVDNKLPVIINSLLNHHVALIHFDEIQRLFKKRKVRGSKNKTEITIPDEKTLDMFMSLFTHGIPILISCTPDGLEGLQALNAIAQRSGAKNHFEFNLDQRESDFINELWKYQYTDGFLDLSEDVLDLIYKLTCSPFALPIKS